MNALENGPVYAFSRHLLTFEFMFCPEGELKDNNEFSINA